jgi:hypothetical protein
MSTPSQGESLTQVDFIAPVRRAGAASAGCLSDLSVEVMQEPWQAKLEGLQEWIYELLIKNQQLRMKLMEMKARELGDDNGHNA